MIYQLQAESLGDWSLGMPMHSFRALGRCDQVLRLKGFIDLVYRRYGLVFGFAPDATLLSLHFIFARGDHDGDALRIAPTTLRLVLTSGASIQLDRTMASAPLCGRLGPPIDDFMSVGQRITQFVVEGQFLQFIHDAQDQLLSLEVTKAA